MVMWKKLAALGAAAVVGVGFAGQPRNAAAQEVELRAAFYTGGVDSPFRVAFMKFVDEVNEKGAGLVRIGDVIGPESVPQNQQGRAMADGLVDIIGVPPSYIDNLLPGMGGLSAARVSTQEMRDNGAFDVVNQHLAGPANARMLGLFAGDIPFYLFTNREVRSLDDFSGLRLRATNTVRAFFEQLGAQPLQIGCGEIYTALERGVADGYSNINSELYAASWIEVVDYRVGPGFYAPNIAIFMNLDRYNSLTDEQKAVLDEAGIFVEGEPSLAMQQEEEAAIERAVAEGRIEVVEFSPEETERFLDMAYDSQWEEILRQAPALGGDLRPLLLGE